jgi:Mce-associated membrane protein
MSDPTGPVRRRRIAGEGKPAVPAKKPAAPKVPARKAAAKKAAMQKAAPPAAPPAKGVATPKTPRPPKITTAKPARETSDGSGLALRWLIPATLVAVAAIVAGVMLTVNGVQHVRGGGGGDELDSSRQQAVSAAGTAATTIFSFSSDKLGEHESASKALMTSSFAKDFAKVAPALTEVTAGRKVVVKAVAREAAPLACGDECSPTKVDVLVFLDQARLVGSSTEPTVFANRISVSMVKTEGGWLVNNIRAL